MRSETSASTHTPRPARSRKRRLGLVLPAVAALVAAAGAGADERFERFASGDIIVQEMDGAEGAAMKAATGSPLTHAGILRISDGGFQVVEAAPPHGVDEMLIEDFLAKGVGGRFAVYRVESVEYDPYWYHPAVLNAFAYLRHPHDPHYRSGTDALYSGELVHLAFKEAGVSLGTFKPIGKLAGRPEVALDHFLSRWREHEDCAARGLDRDGCKSVVEAQRIVTVDSIVRDAKATPIYSSFEDGVAP